MRVATRRTVGGGSGWVEAAADAGTNCVPCHPSDEIQIVPVSAGTVRIRHLCDYPSGVAGAPDFTIASPVQEFVIFPGQMLTADANKDGMIDGADGAFLAPGNVLRMWVNDDDDDGDSIQDAHDLRANGRHDLDRFYPVCLDIARLLERIPPAQGVRYILSEEMGALNFTYTPSPRASAYEYADAGLLPGYGTGRLETQTSASVRRIMPKGVELPHDFINQLRSRGSGVILVEARALTDRPLVLTVEKDGNILLQAKLHLNAFKLDGMHDSDNPANMLFNRTTKDDGSGNADIDEIEPLKDGDGVATYGVARNQLYLVADPVANTLRLRLNMENMPLWFRFSRPMRMAAWDCAANTKVPGTDTDIGGASGPMSVNMAIPAPEAVEVRNYEIRKGVDTNGNDELDDSEAAPLELYRGRNAPFPMRHATVTGISHAKHEESHREIDGLATSTVVGEFAPHAQILLRRFMDGSFPKDADQPASISEVRLDAFKNGTPGDSDFSEWLSHNGGARFSEAGVASIENVTWIGDSEYSQFLANRSPLALQKYMVTPTLDKVELTETGLALKKFYEDNVRALAEEYLADKPEGTAYTSERYSFPRPGSAVMESLSGPSWPVSTVMVGEGSGESGSLAHLEAGLGFLAGDIERLKDYEAYLAVARANLDYQFEVTKKAKWLGGFEYKVTKARCRGTIQDLYDFNYESGGLSRPAAILQMAATTQGRAFKARLYRTEWQIDTTYDDPFETFSISTPP